ncbi:MAG: SDR family NAD(P)-dependent oxidoreductase, partial [Gemmatimonadales bacterium]
IALITGASRGFGLELARLFATDGYDLVLVARDAESLESLAADLRATHGVSVRPHGKDLSLPGAADALWAELAALDVGVDVLVNNAGAGVYGPLAEEDPAALQRMVELNVGALTTLTRLALPPMLRRGWGRILNVASVAAYQPGGPRMAAYYATKAYVLAFSKGIAGELRGTGVSVTALCPGPTKTAFEARSGAGGTALYRWMRGPAAAAVARAGYHGLMRGRAVVIPGLIAKVLAFAGELPPRRIALEVNNLLLRGGRSG